MEQGSATVYNALLKVLQARPRRARSASELGTLVGVGETAIRRAITTLRHKGHNVRNKRLVGFWLEDGPAPPMGTSGGANENWQGEPPHG